MKNYEKFLLMQMPKNTEEATYLLESLEDDGSAEYFLLMAYAHDTLGNETVAEEFYMKAKEKGLPETEVIT